MREPGFWFVFLLAGWDQRSTTSNYYAHWYKSRCAIEIQRAIQRQAYRAVRVTIRDTPIKIQTHSSAEFCVCLRTMSTKFNSARRKHRKNCANRKQTSSMCCETIERKHHLIINVSRHSIRQERSTQRNIRAKRREAARKHNSIPGTNGKKYQRKDTEQNTSTHKHMQDASLIKKKQVRQ